MSSSLETQKIYRNQLGRKLPEKLGFFNFFPLNTETVISSYNKFVHKNTNINFVLVLSEVLTSRKLSRNATLKNL